MSTNYDFEEQVGGSPLKVGGSTSFLNELMPAKSTYTKPTMQTCFRLAYTRSNCNNTVETHIKEQVD